MIITNDTTWRVGEKITLTETVQVAPGVTLTIEPGARIDGNNNALQIAGALSALGTQSQRIQFSDVVFSTNAVTSPQNIAEIDVSFADLKGGSFLGPSNVGYDNFSLTDSLITDNFSYVYAWYPDNSAVIERNVFFRAGGISAGTSNDAQVTIQNNVFAEMRTNYAVENWASYGTSQTFVEYNSFLMEGKTALSLPSGYSNAAMVAPNNWFGTTDREVINSMVLDRSDDLGRASVITIDPPLAAPHADTPVLVPGTAGADDLRGSQLKDTMIGLEGDDILFGGAGDDNLMGSSGSDRLSGGDGADYLSGGDGDDLLIGGSGDDGLFGGNGNDAAIWSSTRKMNTISINPDGADTVSGRDGIDTIHDVERFVFADGEFVTDPGHVAAQVYRLYGATLGREAESGGLKTWVNALNSGTVSLQQAADGFTDSAEFQQRYGQPDNAQFVTLLYANVLDRTPDEPGLENWLNGLNGGMTRAQAVLGFSESAENIDRTKAAVGEGLWLRDDAAASIARLYDTVLDRLPDADGLINWTNALKSGLTLQQAADGFTGSTEFQQRYGSLDIDAFVDLLYRNVLDRGPEQDGLQNWTNALAGGMSRAEVVLGFSESQEHVSQRSAFIDDGVWLL